jgi:hypothetical protein
MNIYKEQWNGLWTLEWNEVQKKFHIEQADTRFLSSLNDFLNKQVSEWYTLGVFNSYKDAASFADSLRKARTDI